MAATREDVLAALRLAFPTGAEAALAELDRYGEKPHENERERVQLAILRLAAGDAAKLAKFVAAPKTDYRDVLVAAEHPMTPAEGEAAQRAAREVIDRWGRKQGAHRSRAQRTVDGQQTET